MHAYESARGELPIASLRVGHHQPSRSFSDASAYAIPDIGPPGNRQSWPPRLCEFVDEPRLAERFPPYMPFDEPPNTKAGTFDGLCA